MAASAGQKFADRGGRKMDQPGIVWQDVSIARGLRPTIGESLRNRLAWIAVWPAFIAGGETMAATVSTPIQHVIIILQENRSFDSYFGTFPGANGIPRGVCLPNDLANPAAGCVAPWHDQHDYQVAANHDADAAQYDMDDGITTSKMDGFVDSQNRTLASICARSKPPQCKGEVSGFSEHDVMGYHTADEIPNYWAYAQHFALQDAMFPGARTWSTPSHVDMTSEWVAICANPNDATTCRTADTLPVPSGDASKTTWPWVSLFQLMDMHHVSWKYYRTNGLDPDCDDEELTCEPDNEVKTPKSDIWNPPPLFKYVKEQGPAYLAAHNPTSDQFWADVQSGNLAQVSWIIPNGSVSEHPFSAGVTVGMEYVTSIVNEVMQSPYWNSTAIFITWDDWGGFYDHVVPPTIEFADPLVNTRSDHGFVLGFGIRVPGLTISPWVKPGLIDHKVLSFASYATFIEDIFMNGARLDPLQMGQPDNRQTVRDALKTATYADGHTRPIGRLLDEFDFSQKPLPPLILSTHIPGKITISCRKQASDSSPSCQLGTVTISWNALTGPGIPGPFTYHVVRDGTELPQCVGTAASCVDTPGSGDHYYRVYSVDSANVTSPLSAAAEAIEP